MAWGQWRGRWRWGTLASVRLVAAVATALLAMGRPLSTPVATSLYLGMSWGAIACYAELARAMSHRALRLLIVVGLLYSVDAVFNLLKWPMIWPDTFGSHDLFHLFVLAGSLAHFRPMLQVVVPSGQPEPAPPASLPDSRLSASPLRKGLKDRAIGKQGGTIPKPRMARPMQRIGKDPGGDDGDDSGRDIVGTPQ